MEKVSRFDIEMLEAQLASAGPPLLAPQALPAVLGRALCSSGYHRNPVLFHH
jgi:hypothetical protein